MKNNFCSFTSFFFFFAPEMFVGSKMCARSLSAAAKPWRGRWRGTLRPHGGSNMRWMRRLTLYSMHAGPFVLRPWTTSWRWERMPDGRKVVLFHIFLYCAWIHAGSTSTLILYARIIVINHPKRHSKTYLQAKQQCWNPTKPHREIRRAE